MVGTRALVLGIDAANPDLVEGWCDEGRLPNLAGLRRNGRVGRTTGIEGFFVGSTWPSFYTGTPPARHGFHYQVQIVPGTYRLHRPSDGAFVRAEPYWSALGRAGRRVAVLDVPLTRLDRSVNGLQIVEWGGHDAITGFGASPRALGREILTRFGPHPGGPTCDHRRVGITQYESFLGALVGGVERRVALTKWMLNRGPWDLLTQVFTESHCVGHQCWHLHDPSHPAHDPDIAAALGDPLLRLYRAIDAAIGELVAAAPGALVLVVVPHGMSHWYGAQFLLPEILIRLGAATRARRSTAGWAGSLADRARHIRARLGLGRPAPSLAAFGIDPAKSRCFVVGNGLAVGGIRLNLAGREPSGALAPGAAADAFMQELRDDLLAIEDGRSGGPLIRSVRRTADLEDGPELHCLPDLLVEWSDALPTGSTRVGHGRAATVRAHSTKIGEVEGTNDFGRTGEHRPGGLVIASGDGLSPARVDEPIRLIDLAPSIASWFGVDLPDAVARPVAALAARVAE